MPFSSQAYQLARCTSESPLLKFAHGVERTVSFELTEDGVPLDLTQFTTSSSSSSSSGSGLTVVFAAAECVGAALVFSIEGTIANAAAGLVHFTFSPEDLDRVGIFVGSLGVLVDGVVKWQTSYYLEIRPTNFFASCAPITIAEVRMELMDTCAEANTLLDDLEFTDEQIAFAIRKAVDTFNETPPGVVQFTASNFPYRANWLDAAAGFLLRSMAHQFRRNALEYSLGGISIRDQERFREYEVMSDRLLVEFKDWARRIQVKSNMEMGFGSIGPSPYGA